MNERNNFLPNHFTSIPFTVGLFTIRCCCDFPRCTIAFQTINYDFRPLFKRFNNALQNIVFTGIASRTNEAVKWMQISSKKWMLGCMFMNILQPKASIFFFVNVYVWNVSCIQSFSTKSPMHLPTTNWRKRHWYTCSSLPICWWLSRWRCAFC